MAHGEFVWCDLASFRPTVTRAFYADLFGWHYPTNEAYSIGHKDGGEICGIFEMPEKFQKIGMPSFWMSYIGSDDLDRTCYDATKLGGKVEIEPSDFAGGGRFALIRDPLGAGFMAYQGNLDVPTNFQPGHRMGHGLFVSDATAIKPFYEALFDWQFDAIRDGEIAVRKDRQIVFYCHQVPDSLQRGKEEYWAVYFDVEDITKISDAAQKAGGLEVGRFTVPEGALAFLNDPDQAFFAVVQRGATVTFGGGIFGKWRWFS